MSDIGREVRTARLARGWSRPRLAEEAGITTTEVEAIEAGHGDPAAAIAALQVVPVSLLVSRIVAGFLCMAEPVVEGIPEDRLPMALAACLDILGRAAAGIE